VGEGGGAAEKVVEWATQPSKRAFITLIYTRVNLRLARAPDAARLRALADPSLSPAAIWFLPALWRAAAGRGAVVVAEGFWRGRPRLVGCGSLTLWVHAAEIADLQVLTGWRDRGIGRALIRALEGEAARLGAGRVEIGAAASNLRARALYERLGYAPARVVSMALPLGEEDVTILEKPLPPA